MSRLVDAAVGAVEKAEIVADIVREDGLEPGAEDIPMAGWSDALFLDQDRGRDVAEDEMAVAVAPVEVSRTDFGIDDQHALRMAGAALVGGGLDAEGRRRPGSVQV